MAQQTAVEWFYEMLKDYKYLNKNADHYFQESKQMEKEKIIEHLIWFQIYLNNKGLITNHDWDFEKLAKQYIKKEYK